MKITLTMLRITSAFPVLIERYNVALDILRVRQISAIEFFWIVIEGLGNA